MLSSEAVIGKPSSEGNAAGSVAEYLLTGYSPSPKVIKPLSPPSVFKTSLTQANGLTTMNFTRKLDPSATGALVRGTRDVGLVMLCSRPLGKYCGPVSFCA